MRDGATPQGPAAPPRGGAHPESQTTRIAALNDEFRRSLTGGRVVMTAGVAALSESARAGVVQAVRSFTAFTTDNDPLGEHDFGPIDHEGCRFFWKIHCYDRALRFASPDATDPAVTVRVLTITCADEY